MIHVIFTFLVLLHLAASETVTLTDAPAYESQRPCAKDCFYLGAYKGPDQLAENIGCDIEDIQNECLCRPDLQAEADAYLKSCVNSGCSKNTLDINSAVSIYDEYCTGAGFQRATNLPATTTSGTDDSPSTVTVTMMATMTVSSAQKRLTSPLQVLVANLAGFRRIRRG